MGQTGIGCVVVTCDGCGDGWEGTDWGTPIHFTSRDEAIAHLVGLNPNLDEPQYVEDDDDSGDTYRWTLQSSLLDGEKWRCRECTAKYVCARDGHVWGEWWRCRCGDPERHGPGKSSEHRSCQRCSSYEPREVDGECVARPAPVPMSRGAQLVQHRANYVIFRLAHPDMDAEPHVVPPEVEVLVAECAAMVHEIDSLLPDEYVVR